MPKYYIWTIGCQMNKAESERLSCYLEKYGYQATAALKGADLIVVNSCVVRQSAENRVIGRLDIMKSLKQSRPEIKLVLTGCLVNSDIKLLKSRFPHVDYFLKPGELPSWLEENSEVIALPQSPQPSVYIPIIQGCNNFCTYCIVPYRRGREKSRLVTEIVSEVEELVKRGAQEVTLLGQNVDSYGQDLPEKPDLAVLLEEINAIEGLKRIRFLTNHPKDMTSRLIDAIARLDKVCEELSLPVQAGNNGILTAMGRGYSVERYIALVKEIRAAVPDIGLITDVIVGFPSETDAQFRDTFNLLSEIRFDKVHIAAYSPRKGTAAERDFKDDIPVSVKKLRLSQLEDLQKEIVTRINTRLLDETVEILVEGKKGGKWQGRTRSGKLVFFESASDYSGRLVNLVIDKTSPWSLQGKLVVE